MKLPNNHQIITNLETAQAQLNQAHARLVVAQEQFNAAKQALNAAQAQSDAAQAQLARAYADFFGAMQAEGEAGAELKARLNATLQRLSPSGKAPDFAELDLRAFLDQAVSDDPKQQAVAGEQLSALGAVLASLGIYTDADKLAHTPANMRESYRAPEQSARRAEALQALSAEAEDLVATMPAQAEPSNDAAALSPFEKLGHFLEADGWHPRRVNDQPTYQMTFKGDHGQALCFAQVEDDMQQLLFYVVVPVKAPEARRPAVAEYITRANYGLRIGNFEFDYGDGEVRYKSSLDFESVGLTADLLRDTLYPAINTFDRYFPGLMAVIYENRLPEAALDAIENV